MLEHRKIEKLSDFFSDLNQRRSKGVYFYRINSYSDEIGEFIKKYYDTARRSGVVIEGKIPNPNEKNIAFYNEIMGMSFQNSLPFIRQSLKKWLPRMNNYQLEAVATSIFDFLQYMLKNGKNENMLKNAYIKFMCWLYYKFERIVNQLGENTVPKILYEGDISNYELMLITILSNSGCDVVLLQYNGDGNYIKLDPTSSLSDKLTVANAGRFPNGYCIKAIRDEIQNDFNKERLYGTRPNISNCTNKWIKGKGFDDVREDIRLRGNDTKLFYNCFIRINGVEDKLIYANELFGLQQELKNKKRKLVIINNEISKPDFEEINNIKRKNYSQRDDMIIDLCRNINFSFNNTELQSCVRKAFVDVLLLKFDDVSCNLNKLTNKAVYLLCWLKRYFYALFSEWKPPEIGCFIHLGGCKTDTEALFLSLLAKLPVDVLILCPNLNNKCCLSDKLLYEVNYKDSLVLEKYPESNSQARIGTAAYHAERELDVLMYQDTGIFRNQQYSKASIINLSTMYEEIKILWDQDLKYRPGFGTSGETVNIPVIFSKISGVKNNELMKYWTSIKELITPETVVIKEPSLIKYDTPNPFKGISAEFYKNGKLQKQKIKNHSRYPYDIIREDMQDLMLEKLELLINQKLIKGIGENGTEYLVIAQFLNLPKNIVRLIQNFDFTKKNPKIVYINTSENVISLEDSIMIVFLNLIGFDIIFFVPTGYKSVEKYFKKGLVEEHQIGEYKYDLSVPDLNSIQLNNTRPNWREKIFKRGN